MYHRSEDRRGSSRFEILGTLVGSLEIWHRLAVRNLSARGALVESAELYSPGTSLRGQVTVQGRSLDLRADVRHVEFDPAAAGGARYLVGLEFLEELSSMNDLFAERPAAGEAMPVVPERRLVARIACPGDAEIRVPAWITVALKDLSSDGTMFASKAAFEPGSRLSLRTRLGDRTFAADVEVCRSDAQGSAARIGASFVSMDEESRRNLAAFLATAAV